MGFCQVDAGILNNDGELTEAAKQKIIKEVKNEITFGTANMPKPIISCGPNVPPQPNAEALDLEDRSKFPDFHEKALNIYRSIANFLNFEGQFMFAPLVYDPIAIGAALDAPNIPDIKFPEEFIPLALGGPATIPTLAPLLGLDPIKLPDQIASLIVPKVPSLSIPSFNTDIVKFPALAAFELKPYVPINGIPPIVSTFIELALKIPTLLPDLLRFNFDGACETVINAGLFGDVVQGATMQVALAKALSRATVECIIIAIVGATVGSSAQGITGGLGQVFGY